MSSRKSTVNGSSPDELFTEHFHYVRRGLNGEYIIPEEKVEDFVRRYGELADNRDHLERLRAYLNDEKRSKPGELDD